MRKSIDGYAHQLAVALGLMAMAGFSSAAGAGKDVFKPVKPHLSSTDHVHASGSSTRRQTKSKGKAALVGAIKDASSGN